METKNIIFTTSVRKQLIEDNKKKERKRVVSENWTFTTEDYAYKNGYDVIFGYVAENSSFSKDSRETYYCDVDMIKNWLYRNGYAINDLTNEFHKVIKLA